MSAQNTAPQRSQEYDVDSESAENESEQAETTAPAEPEELSLDLIFEVLKNRRRRDVIRYLEEQSERTSLSDLAEHVAALENDTTTQALTSSQRKRVYVGLYQCHLPKMDDMDIVNFNQDRGYVEARRQRRPARPVPRPRDDRRPELARTTSGSPGSGSAPSPSRSPPASPRHLPRCSSVWSSPGISASPRTRPTWPRPASSVIGLASPRSRESTVSRPRGATAVGRRSTVSPGARGTPAPTHEAYPVRPHFGDGPLFPRATAVHPPPD